MAVKICRNCGESNSESAVLCVICSSALREVPLEGTPNARKEFSGVLDNKINTCWYCNEKIEEDVFKCKHCGSTVIKRAKSDFYSRTNAPGGDSLGCAAVLLFIATLFVPIVGLIVGGIFAFSDDPNKKGIGKGLLIFGLIIIFIGLIIGFFIT